jgi:hypothetical protein
MSSLELGYSKIMLGLHLHRTAAATTQHDLNQMRKGDTSLEYNCASVPVMQHALWERTPMRLCLVNARTPKQHSRENAALAANSLIIAPRSIVHTLTEDDMLEELPWDEAGVAAGCQRLLVPGLWCI